MFANPRVGGGFFSICACNQPLPYSGHIVGVVRSRRIRLQAGVRSWPDLGRVKGADDLTTACHIKCWLRQLSFRTLRYLHHLKPCYSKRVPAAEAQAVAITLLFTPMISTTDFVTKASPLAASSRCEVTFCDPMKPPLES